jgi:hypothetical protein
MAILNTTTKASLGQQQNLESQFEGVEPTFPTRSTHSTTESNLLNINANQIPSLNLSPQGQDAFVKITKNLSEQLHHFLFSEQGLNTWNNDNIQSGQSPTTTQATLKFAGTLVAGIVAASIKEQQEKAKAINKAEQITGSIPPNVKAELAEYSLRSMSENEILALAERLLQQHQKKEVIA